ncbi:MAG TPA: hypothetical protein VFB54_02660 [Burkholderiales bacterium]|nr:hypothetical protein [Burkholderiales bacterium]
MGDTKSWLEYKGAKVLFLLNLSSAVVVVAWLTLIWDLPWAVQMRMWHAFGVMAFGAGTMLALVSFFVRYFPINYVMLYPQGGPWWIPHITAALQSLVSFIIGCGLLVYGTLLLFVPLF